MSAAERIDAPARCDDCRAQYTGPAYYTFDRESCMAGSDDGHDCTGNLGPECAGPYLEPDRPDDPRRPRDEEVTL